MPIDTEYIIDALERSIGLMPAAALAIILLVTPTALWLLYRFVVQPRTSRFGVDAPDMLWICEQCRSANEVRLVRCYRCGLERDEIVGDIHVVEPSGDVVLLRGDASALTVEPAPSGAPVPVMERTATDMGMRPLVAVGPGETGDARPSTALPAAAPDDEAIVTGRRAAPTAATPRVLRTVTTRRPAAGPVARDDASEA